LTALNSVSGDDNSSARETSGSPTPPPQSISIQNAIDEAPAAELKRLVQRLLADVPQARPLIESTLLRPLGNGESSSNGLKRKATEECKNCKQFYQIEDNQKGVCRYHPCKFLMIVTIYRLRDGDICLPSLFALPAEPEVDLESTTWEDHDPNVFGEPEDLTDDPTYEDGFIMSCCDKRPSEAGCVISRHKPNIDSQRPAQRVRR
jgi:hypothetical protein